MKSGIRIMKQAYTLKLMIIVLFLHKECNAQPSELISPGLHVVCPDNAGCSTAGQSFFISSERFILSHKSRVINIFPKKDGSKEQTNQQATHWPIERQSLGSFYTGILVRRGRSYGNSI